MSIIKRKLTEYEIEDILSFIKPTIGIPYEAAMSTVKINKLNLRKQLQEQLVYTEIIPYIKEDIEFQYMSSLVQPGENVGITMAQSIGEKQTQMVLNSIDYTDIILYIRDNIPYIEPIGKMIDRLMTYNSYNIILYQENKTEYLELTEGFFIPSVDENGLNKWRKIEAVTRHQPTGKLVKITTGMGRVVSASQCKSFLVWNGNKFVNTLGSEVKTGDILPTTKNLVKFKNEISYIYPYMILNSHTIKKYTDSKLIHDKIYLDNNFGFLIGSFVASGYCVHNILVVLKDNFLITKWCDINKIEYLLNEDSGSLMIKSQLLVHILNFICYDEHNTKRFPLCSYTAPDIFITGIIYGYTNSYNNNISNKNMILEIPFLNNNLSLGFSFLLSYFCIIGVLSTNKITIIDNFAKLFNKTFIPNIIYNVQEEEKSIYPLTRDVYFDTIIKIEHIDATNGLVYDFTVSDTRNFNLFNGLGIVDTFHTAGKGSVEMTQGVPRFSELLNATKNPKTVCCFVYFKDEHKSIKELRNTIKNSLVEITFKKIIKKYTVSINKTPEPWYDSFTIIYNNDFEQYEHCISLELDIDILYEYCLTMEEISDSITNEYEDMACVWSPDHIGKFDIYVDTNDITLPEERILYIDNDNAPEIYIEEVVYPTLENMIICGISGLKDIFFNKDKLNWMVETIGGTLSDIFAIPIIDMYRTFSNNMWDIYNTLGIEAARQFLIDEYMRLLDGINICHVKILVERMTFDGTISSISRYTMRTDESGPFSKCSFEETLDNFLRAAIFGDEEPTVGVSASIICGKRAKMGTGLCELKMDIDMLEKLNL